METRWVAVLQRLIKISDLRNGGVEELLAFVDCRTFREKLFLALRHLNFKIIYVRKVIKIYLGSQIAIIT